MNPTFLRIELLRILRDRKTVLIIVVMPALFFLLFSSGGEGPPQIYGGLSAQAYAMISMATYATSNALFTAGGRIAVERKAGWNRQLRLAGVSGRTYLPVKVLLAYATAIPGFVVVLVLAVAVRGVTLPVHQWGLLFIAILLTLAPIAALGVWVGYLAAPETLQPVFGLGGALIAMAGGMLIPIGVFGATLRSILELLPPYWATYAGRAALQDSWIGWRGVAVLAVWTVLLSSLAARAYRRDTQK